MTRSSVFISYRREDTAGEAGRLAEHLARRFGADRVFLDIDAIAPGADFVDALDRALGTTAVVLVVIGRQWLTATNPDGTRRLDDPHDFVHREIATALARGARVIPVLVQNTSMPTAAMLPASLASLATRQAMAIQHEEFVDDAGRLANAIAPLLDDAPSSAHASLGRPARRHGRAVVAFAIVAAAALGVVVVRAQRASADSARAAAVLRARADSVRALVSVAAAQRDRGRLADALTTLDAAVAVDAPDSAALALREEVAMQWIRDLVVADGQTFLEAMSRPLAVLDRAAPFAQGARQADLLAHLGWSVFLRWRDSRANPTPVDTYRRALAVDSTNPFANVMLGHWILSYESGPDVLARARRHFRTAADARRETAVVRRFQLAALRNDRRPDSRLETIRVLHEMRMRDEPRPESLSDAWSTYYFALNGQASITVRDLMALLPPSEHLQTYRWAFGEYAQRDDGSMHQFRFYVARLRMAAGDTAMADSLRALRGELGGGMLRDAVDAALAEAPTSRR